MNAMQHGSSHSCEVCGREIVCDADEVIDIYFDEVDVCALKDVLAL